MKRLKKGQSKITNPEIFSTVKRTLLALASIICLSDLFAQNPDAHRFSGSLLWTPVYYGPNDGKFRLDNVIPVAFEGGLEYRISNRFAVSAGAGYQESHLLYSYSSILDNSTYAKLRTRTFGIPVNFFFYLNKGERSLEPYIRTGLIKEFEYSNTKEFANDQLVRTHRYHDNSTVIDLGLGTQIKLSEWFGIICEGSIGTYISNPPECYILKVKVGFVIK